MSVLGYSFMEEVRSSLVWFKRKSFPQSAEVLQVNEHNPPNPMSWQVRAASGLTHHQAGQQPVPCGKVTALEPLELSPSWQEEAGAV